MKILKLTSENIKRISAIEITPDGSLVVVGGNNEQGKTSVLDSITYALGGADTLPVEPIRRGQERAQVVVDLGDIKVTRVFTKKGTRLEVANKDGAIYKSPQAILDRLIGQLTFDPLEFSRMDPKKQVGTLKGLAGLNFDDMDKEIQTLYQERTMVNRDIKTARVQIDGRQKHEVPKEEVAVSELAKAMELMIEKNGRHAAKRKTLENLKANVENQKAEIQALQDQIAKLEEKLKVKAITFEEAKNSVATYQQEVASLQDEDIAAVKKQIEDAEAVNKEVRYNKETVRQEVALGVVEEKADGLTKKLSEIEKKKADALASAKFPIESLGFNDSGVTYKGIPWEQCSSAEQLRVSVSMGLSMNPKLKILLIRDGSLLDEKNLALIAQMAAEADAQVWIERVGEGKEVSVIIEDGAVKA